MAVTILDIAKHLDLSVSTVSRALNGYGDVAKETRKRVEEAAKEFDYHPSDAARSLRQKRTNRVGLLIPSTIHYMGEFFSELIRGVTLALAESGSNLMLYTTTTDEVAQLTRICRAREVDGIILFSADKLDEAISFLKTESLPFVVLGHSINDPAVSFVASDNRGGMMAAMQHLLSSGHSRIAYLARYDQPRLHSQRLLSYQQALTEAGLEIDGDLVTSASIGTRTGYRAMNSLLDLPVLPTAVIAFNDQIAINALQAASERHVSVPDDLSIVGYNDIRSSLSTVPQLTTVRQPLSEMGKKAAEVLLSRVHDNDIPPIRTNLPAELIIRGSTSHV